MRIGDSASYTFIYKQIMVNSECIYEHCEAITIDGNSCKWRNSLSKDNRRHYQGNAITTNGKALTFSSLAKVGL